MDSVDKSRKEDREKRVKVGDGLLFCGEIMARLIEDTTENIDFPCLSYPNGLAEPQYTPLSRQCLRPDVNLSVRFPLSHSAKPNLKCIIIIPSRVELSTPEAASTITTFNCIKLAIIVAPCATLRLNLSTAEIIRCVIVLSFLMA